MKRISLLMIALSFLAFVGVAKAQQTLTVHDGTATNRYVPFYGYWADATQQNQMIYPASDFPGAMVGGQISQMVFYIDPSQGNTYGSGVGDWVVSLGTTDGTTLSGLDTSTELTEVFSGNLDAVIVGNTMTITFSQNFIYTGGNLLVEFNHPNASSYKDYYFFGEEVTGAAYTYNAARNFLPKTTFSYTPGSGDPVVVESIEADDLTVGTGHTAQINYTVLPADAWYKQVSFASANTSIATVNQDGLVTAVAVGETTITITSVEYPTISTTINVTVEQSYEITIGEGNSTSSDLPLNMYYNYGLSEQLYTAQEIGVGACNINSVAFKLVSGTASKTYALDVYMMNTDKTTITNEDYVNVTSDDLVFSGNVNFTTGDWTTIQFTTPFTYTGGNVLLVVDNNTGDYDGYSRYFAVFSATQQAIYQRSDQTNFDPTNISNISSASYKNQVIFGYTPINVIPVESITADDITMMTGETAQITPTVLPADANQAVTYASANTSIATVSEDGLVTAVAAGTTTITITSVSTPEVSTTINVTVNSNPDNVVFTVNAPATAQPGDVITVEAYLNAPASGNYNGFTGLVLGLHFDTEAFEPYGNPVKGPVAETSTMSMPSLPNETHPDLVQMGCVMPVGTPNPTTGLVFSMQFTVLAETGSYDFYAEPTWASETVSNFVCRLSMDEAAVNIPYEVTPSTVAVGVQTITLDITGYGESAGGYYLIASPIGEVSPTNVGGMLDNEYDLYYFDQAQDLEWINYKGDDGNFNLVPGKGYLYANSEDVTLTFIGTPYSGDGTVELVYDDNAVDFKGWNLVGNPFAETAYIDRTEFYVMKSDGTEVITPESNEIGAMEGIFVVAAEDGEYVTFSTSNANLGKGQIVLNVTQDQGNVIDRAIVRFGQGGTLPKFMLNQNNTKLYIPKDNKDFAVVRSSNSGRLPVNFEPAQDGVYFINVSVENLSNMKYLHLVDHEAGLDFDLLQDPVYKFEAKTNGKPGRFELVFKKSSQFKELFSSNSGISFSFCNNGNWIINNEGDAVLQVIDINGRILSNEEISGSVSKRIDAAPGVYMLRLINNNDVKVQKIVVE